MVLKSKNQRGVIKMETKSRYEVIAELEEKKRGFIIERDSLEQITKNKGKEIKNLKRQLEDMEENLEEFKETLKEKRETLNELIKSVDESLKRFETMSKSQKT